MKNDKGDTMEQGESADSCCPEFTRDEAAGFTVITVYDQDELENIIREMKRLEGPAS